MKRRNASVKVLALLLMAAFPISILSLQPNWVSTLAYAVDVGQAGAAEHRLATAGDLSLAFRDVAKTIRPSVVSISSIKRIKPQNPRVQRFGGTVPPEFQGFFGDDMLERFFEFRVPQRGLEQRGLGSGVIVSDDGYILTNHHVVGEADEVNVTLSDDRQYRAEIVGGDKSTDIAVLKIAADNLKPAKLGDSESLEVGEWVVAMGSPFGLDQTVTAGIISATGRANVGITDYEDFIQTDAAINPGNSGGPLLNLRGEVIGINTAIASRSGGYMGVGFAIPSEMAEEIMGKIIDEGFVARGWLGAMIQDLDEDLAASFGYGSSSGVLIGDLLPNGPGKKAGMKPGDIVVRLDGDSLADANELRNRVAAAQPGSEVTLEVFRDRGTIQLQVKLGTLGGDTLSAASDSQGSNDLGVQVQELTRETAQRLDVDQSVDGVVVTNVEPGGLAAEAGLRPKDVIVSVGDAEIKSAADFQQAVSNGSLEEGLRLRVFREGLRRFVVVKAD